MKYLLGVMTSAGTVLPIRADGDPETIRKQLNDAGAQFVQFENDYFARSAIVYVIERPNVEEKAR